MKIDCQRVHCHDFVGLGTRQVRESRGQVLVIRDPRSSGFFVAQYGQSRPVIELLIDQSPCPDRHQAQRMAAQIQKRLAARVGGYCEAVAKCAQYVGFVERSRVFECGLHDCSNTYSRGRLGTASPPIAGTWISSRYGPSATAVGM